MFIDSVNFTLSSGKGGAGCVSFRREKFVTKGGPDGGDGGDGGSVFVKIDKNTDTLSYYQGLTHLEAKNGKPGEGKKKYGKRGESLTLLVPPGTQIFDTKSGELILDTVNLDEKEHLLLKGGLGGLGNVHFRNSRNQAPTYAQPGLEGESIDVRLELKLIANVGLVGFPNVGKSTLISNVSNARPEVANYEFTTLTPKLGVVEIGEYESFVMADIPGIIEGASDGKGLGIDFLRHIERTQTLLFMIDLSNYRDPVEQYEKLKIELERYSSELKDRAFGIALTKADALEEDVIKEKLTNFYTHMKITPNKVKKYNFHEDYDTFVQVSEYDEAKVDYTIPYFIAPISSASRLNIEPLKYVLFELVQKEKANAGD